MIKELCKVPVKFPKEGQALSSLYAFRNNVSLTMYAYRYSHQFTKSTLQFYYKSMLACVTPNHFFDML